LSQNSSIFLYSALAVLCLLIIALLIYKNKHRSSALKMHKILEPYIRDEIKEIIVPDGIGGLLEIEHLILTDQGLLLVETYPMSGNLFGADTIDQWTQIIDGRSYKFANPLRHIRTSRQAIKAITPNIPIFCRVVFNANSEFPKGKPEEVSVLTSLANDMVVMSKDASVTLASQKAWDKIMRIARKNGQAVEREGEQGGR